MQIEQHAVGDVVVLKVTGDIAIGKDGEGVLEETIRTLTEQGRTRLLLDLAGVSYVDSAGLGELVRAYSTTKACGGALKLLRVGRHLQELLVVTTLSSVFESFDDEARAIASFATTSA